MRVTTITTVTEKNVAFEAVTDTGLKIKAIYRAIRDSQQKLCKTTRVYGAMDALAPELMKLEPFANNYGEGYYSIPAPSEDRSPEDNVRGAMWHAWKRETVKVVTGRMTELLDEVAGVAAVKLNGTGAHLNAPIDGSGKKPSFSQTAGCSCPCSPGFVLNTRWVFSVANYARPIDLHIEVIATETTPA